jgi:predicted permease
VIPRDRWRWLRATCSRIFRRKKHEAALDAELQFHLQQLIAEYRAEGLSERDAQLFAQREFGAVAAYREEIRDSWRPPELADLWRTFRFAAGSLARTPGFTLLAIVALGFGVGGNTVMFSGFNSIVLKPLPYPNAAQLDSIDRATPQNPKGRVSPADFLDLQRESQTYGQIAAYMPSDATLSEPGHMAEVASGLRISPNFFATLAVQPRLGRDFRPDENLPGKDRLVILSERYWQKRFGGDPDVVGRIIRIDGEPHQIIGVLAASFNDWRHLGWVNLFRPIAFDHQQTRDRHSTILRLIGRRADNVSRSAAENFIANFGARLAKDFPEINAGTAWHAVPLAESIQGKSARSMLGMLIALSGFVLLIACSNLANLLLARTISRAREFAVRSALGASRMQLLRPVVTELLLLAVAGGLFALVVARWGADWLSVRSTGENGERLVLAFDWRVFGWAAGAALVTAIVFGLAPALFALRLNVNDTLKSGARGMTGGSGHRRFRQLLIVGQFALAMILLAGAAICIRGVDELNHRRAGWDSERLVTGTIILPARYSHPAKITAFHRLIIQRLESVPGIASASVSSFTPFFNWSDTRKYFIQGRDIPRPGHEPTAVVNTVSLRYFETVGTRLLAGRLFDDADMAGSPKTFIVSQSMASALFPNENPIGHHLAQAGGTDLQWGEIVGVVADVQSVLPDPGPVTFQLYQPMAQEPRTYNELAVRTGEAPAAMIDTIRNVMMELDPDLPVRQLQTADATIDRANYQLAVLRDMLSAFAVLGLGLASLGIYGVIARIMAQRTNEFAIRMALGACIRDITRIVLISGVKLALLGSVLGLIGAIAVGRILVARNPAMQLNSLPVLVATTLLLIVIALVACWLPARRASQLSPAEALRAE